MFDLLHLYGLEAFKVDGSLPSGSDEDDSDNDRDDQGEDEEKEEEQNKTAANSAVAILSGLLDSEVRLKVLFLDFVWRVWRKF